MNNERTACLVLDEYRGFAKIIYSDAREGPHYATKRQALEMIRGLEGIAVSKEELEIFEMKIKKSCLINEHRGIEQMYSWYEARIAHLEREVVALLIMIHYGNDDGDQWKKRE